VKLPQTAQIQGLHQIAQSLGTKKALKINHLYEYVGIVTVRPMRQPLFVAAVEFSSPMAIGFAHG
jgi:hypothetical protein